MDLDTLLYYVTSGEFYVALVAVMAALKGLAEALSALGRLRQGKDWADNAGGQVLGLVDEVGKFANFFAPGNKKESPGIVLRVLQLFKR